MASEVANSGDELSLGHGCRRTDLDAPQGTASLVIGTHQLSKMEHDLPIPEKQQVVLVRQGTHDTVEEGPEAFISKAIGLREVRCWRATGGAAPTRHAGFDAVAHRGRWAPFHDPGGIT